MIGTGVVTKYYFAGTQRIAMRKGGVLTYMLSDHLGSTSLIANASGAVISETRYTAWGEVRYQAGTTSTGYTYTGQYSNTADFGLMFYNARWYDPQLGRFAQADTIVPAGVQGYDRYAYGLNNPSRYTDPSGHSPVCEDLDCGHNYPTNSGGNKDKNKKEEGCKGLECIHSHDEDNDIPLLPPSPFACDWYDCALSLASVIFSLGTFPGMPVEIQGPAYILDIAVTVLAYFSTEDAYARGEITDVHRKALNATGILGAFPSPFGIGLSIFNLLFTTSGYPH